MITDQHTAVHVVFVGYVLLICYAIEYTIEWHQALMALYNGNNTSNRLLASHLDDLGSLLLTQINFNPSMDK